MKKSVYLIRHGQIQSNIEDVYAGRNDEKLTEPAVLESEELGRKLRGLGISVIYTSPITRTLQTSEIINRHIEARLVVESDLIEMELGPWTGLSKREVARRYPSAFDTWVNRPAEFKMEGMETLEEIVDRMKRVFHTFLEMDPAKIGAVVTHAVIIKCAYLYFNNLALNAYHNVRVSNLSVHEVTFQGDVTSVKKMM